MAPSPGEYFFNFLLISMVALPVYYAMPWRLARQLMLILTGLYLMYLIAPRVVIYWAGYWVAVWGFHAGIRRTTDRRSRAMLFSLSIIAMLLPMVLWKLYAPEFESWFNIYFHETVSFGIPLLGSVDSVRPVLIPLGLSFSTFRALDLLICTQLDLHGRLRLVDILTYGLFPPLMIVGPIAQYSEVEHVGVKQPGGKVWEDISAGGFRIALGYFKLYVIAFSLRQSEDVILHFQENTQGWVWLSVFLYSWYLYINFSGFSDLGIGTARLFGVRLNENFNFPYFRRNLQQFWANWHMSLTRFAQRNVFVPLGGFRVKRQYVATFLTMMVIALWHDLSFSLILFGTLHGMVLIGLRYASTRRTDPENPGIGFTLAGTAATYCFVMLTIPLLLISGDNIRDFYMWLLLGHS